MDNSNSPFFGHRHWTVVLQWQWKQRLSFLFFLERHFITHKKAGYNEGSPQRGQSPGGPNVIVLKHPGDWYQRRSYQQPNQEVNTKASPQDRPVIRYPWGSMQWAKWTDCINWVQTGPKSNLKNELHSEKCDFPMVVEVGVHFVLMDLPNFSSRPRLIQ